MFRLILRPLRAGAVFEDFERAALHFALNSLDVAVFQNERLVPDRAGHLKN